MFDFGWGELLIIAIGALIVIGPKDLPGMFRALGRIVAKAKSIGREFQHAMDEAAREAELDDVKKDLESIMPRTGKVGALTALADKMDEWQPFEDAHHQGNAIGESATSDKNSAAGEKTTKKPSTKPNVNRMDGLSQQQMKERFTRHNNKIMANEQARREMENDTDLPAEESLIEADFTIDNSLSETEKLRRLQKIRKKKQTALADLKRAERLERKVLDQFNEAEMQSQTDAKPKAKQRKSQHSKAKDKKDKHKTIETKKTKVGEAKTTLSLKNDGVVAIHSENNG